VNVKRVLIKVSGEFLGANGKAFDCDRLMMVCQGIKNVIDRDIGVSVVIGGGNIVRGRDIVDIKREVVDNMGMLATTINGLALQSGFHNLGIKATILSPIALPFGIGASDSATIAEHMAKCRVIIFVCGAGLPYFSTDTISVMHSLTTKSDILLKATKPDGIYDKDPAKYLDAVHIHKISHKEALALEIAVMDRVAFSIAQDYALPILVFSINEENCFIRAIDGTIKHSLVS
jgi:uridylate kinase